jgi:DNA repair exonuclease SbcCD ATPase subunit
MTQELQSRLQMFRSAVSLIQEQVKYEAAQITRLKGKITQLEEDKKMLIKAVGVIDKAITVISANGIGKIESIVSGGLQLVWPELSFVVEKREGVRGNSYRLLLRKGNVVGPPMDTHGGGPVNVCAFLLRVIMVKRFKLAKFLAIDEGFNNVSADNLPQVSAMLTRLCHDHGFTILAVTHQPILAESADIMYEVGPGPVLNKIIAGAIA